MSGFHHRNIRLNGETATPDGTFRMFDHCRLTSKNNFAHVRKRKAAAAHLSDDNDDDDDYNDDNEEEYEEESSPNRTPKKQLGGQLPFFIEPHHSSGTLFMDDSEHEGTPESHDNTNQDEDMDTADAAEEPVQRSVSPPATITQTSRTAPQGSSREPYAEAPVHKSRAYHMKRHMAIAQSANSYRRRYLPEHDPENHSILRMRTEEKMHWSEICSTLNAQRSAEGKPGVLTDAAVYGRFVRNAPRIARLEGYELDPKDHMHIRQKKLSRQEPEKLARWSNHHDEALVQTYHEVQNTIWTRVAEVMEDKTGMQFDPKDCFSRYELL